MNKARFVRLTLAIVVGCVILVPTILTHLLLLQIEKRLGLEIHNKPTIHLTPNLITLESTSIVWNNRLSVYSGRLTIHVDLMHLLSSALPVSIDGRRVAVKLGAKWAKAVGREEVLFDQIDARILIHRNHELEVDYLNAHAKDIDFALSSKN